MRPIEELGEISFINIVLSLETTVCIIIPLYSHSIVCAQVYKIVHNSDAAVCKVTLHGSMLTFNGSSIQGSSRFGGSNHPNLT